MRIEWGGVHSAKMTSDIISGVIFLFWRKNNSVRIKRREEKNESNCKCQRKSERP
jgi:hypothetical protein